MLEMELTLIQHILIYMLVILIPILLLATQVIMEVTQATAMKDIHIDIHIANLQQDIEVILCWNILFKSKMINYRKLKRMFFRPKRLSHTSQSKRVKSQKRNGIQLPKRVIWKLKKKDQREE